MNLSRSPASLNSHIQGVLPFSSARFREIRLGHHLEICFKMSRFVNCCRFEKKKDGATRTYVRTYVRTSVTEEQAPCTEGWVAMVIPILVSNINTMDRASKQACLIGHEFTIKTQRTDRQTDRQTDSWRSRAEKGIKLISRQKIVPIDWVRPSQLWISAMIWPANLLEDRTWAFERREGGFIFSPWSFLRRRSKLRYSAGIFFYAVLQLVQFKFLAFLLEYVDGMDPDDTQSLHMTSFSFSIGIFRRDRRRQYRSMDHHER